MKILAELDWTGPGLYYIDLSVTHEQDSFQFELVSQAAMIGFGLGVMLSMSVALILHCIN